MSFEPGGADQRVTQELVQIQCRRYSPDERRSERSDSARDDTNVVLFGLPERVQPQPDLRHAGLPQLLFE